MPRLSVQKAAPAEPKRRGPKKGTVYRADFEHVCPAPGCPREGEPFKGTQSAVYCGQRCNLAAWRARQREDEEKVPA